MQFKNLTIEVPLSATQHGNSRIFCIRGSPWKDALSVVTFFTTSYIAHAATVKSTPGEGTISMAFNTFIALCFPMFGLLRALNAIARGARFGGSELRNACRAGALCMVVRNSEWRPEPGDTLEAVLADNSQPGEENNVTADIIDAKMINYFPTHAREDSSAWAYFDTIGSRAYVDPDLTRIHGTYSLSKGYAFAIVPRNACLLEINRFNTASLTPHGDTASSATVGISQPFGTETIVHCDSSSRRNLDRDRATLQSAATASTTPTNQIISNLENFGPSSGHIGTPTERNGNRPSANSDISSSYSVAKSIASLIQVLVALSILLLRTSGSIERWGYASFHLTVIPYLVMTVVNFASNALAADYACLYMVESGLMREARNRDSRFEGTVAALKEYSGSLSSDISAKDLAYWTGFTQKHVRHIARFLSGEWLSNVLFGRDRANFMFETSRRKGPTTSCIRLTCKGTVETNYPQSESTTGGDQQGHQSVNQTLQESSNIEMEQFFSNGPLAATNENSSRLAANERIESDIPGTYENHPQLAVEDSRPNSLANSPVESGVILTSSNGQRYRIHRFVPTPWLDPKLFFARDNHREVLPQSSDDISHGSTILDRLERLMIEYHMYYYTHFFRELDPIRLRLAVAVKQVKENSTGSESWKTLIVMLYKSLSEHRSEAGPENSPGHKSPKMVIYVPNCSPFVREDKHKDQPPKGRGNAGVMMVIEILLGCFILGLLIVVLGWLSHWFSHGESSRTERAIIVLWMVEGAFGLLLPLLSLKELIMVFLLLPIYALRLRQQSSFVVSQLTQTLYLLAFAPVGIFVAPIWGFVIVGRQLVEWGNCVSLY